MEHQRRHAREWYPVEIVTDPPVDAWGASVHDRTTWTTPPTSTTGSPAGSCPDPTLTPGTATVLTDAVTTAPPAIDTPEVVVGKARRSRPTHASRQAADADLTVTTEFTHAREVQVPSQTASSSDTARTVDAYIIGSPTSAASGRWL